MKRSDVAVTITDYEATIDPSWKVKVVVRDKTNGRQMQEAIGIGYWQAESEQQKAPAAVYPHWFVIKVDGSKDVYEQSEQNDLLKIVKKPD